jgi:insulysin
MMLSHPESQYNRFDVGCLKSLKQEGIRDRLIEFHQKWYSANLMNLVICGNHTLDQLE